jgi:signal transduction histidine kinase
VPPARCRRPSPAASRPRSTSRGRTWSKPAARSARCGRSRPRSATNAVRHANARRIHVVAEGVRSIGFRLSVADDGRGIAKERRGTGFGMTSMQERADRIGASLTVVTAARSGTEVVLAWEPASFAIPDLIAHGNGERL